MSTYVGVKERLHPGLLDSFVRGGAQSIEIFAAKGMVKSSLATVWRRRSAHAAHRTSRCSWVLLGG